MEDIDSKIRKAAPSENVYEKHNFLCSMLLPDLDSVFIILFIFSLLSSCRGQPVNRKNINLTREKNAIERRGCRVKRAEKERRVNWRDKMSDLYRLYYSLLCLCLSSPPSALTHSFRPV